MRIKVFGVLFIFLFCFSSIGYSQSIKDRMFYTFGYSLTLEVLSVFDVEYMDSNGANVVDQIQLSGYGFGLDSRIRMNIININDNSSFSVDVIPELNYFRGYSRVLDRYSYNEIKSGIAGVLPVFASFNIGAGSTYDTDKNYGLGISGGFEYQYVLHEFGDKKLNNHGFFYPSVQLSLRYWRDNSNSLRELSFKFGIPTNSSNLSTEAETPFVASIAWSKYLNY